MFSNLPGKAYSSCTQVELQLNYNTPDNWWSTSNSRTNWACKISWGNNVQSDVSFVMTCKQRCGVSSTFLQLTHSSFVISWTRQIACPSFTCVSSAFTRKTITCSCAVAQIQNSWKLTEPTIRLLMQPGLLQVSCSSQTSIITQYLTQSVDSRRVFASWSAWLTSSTNEGIENVHELPSHVKNIKNILASRGNIMCTGPQI